MTIPEGQNQVIPRRKCYADMEEWRFGMGKVRYWYDDAMAEAWAGAGFLAFAFGSSCAFVPAQCVPIVGFAALVIFVALTVPLVYLIVTSKRRPNVASAEPGKDAKTR